MSARKSAGSSKPAGPKGAPSPGQQNDDGLGVPTDTLASSAKSKSLQGRNRELRFICEREKRILDWEWHSVKVQFEKEKMLFKKRALRMLEAPRRRFRRPPGEETDEECDEDEVDNCPYNNATSSGRAAQTPSSRRRRRISASAHPRTGGHRGGAVSVAHRKSASRPGSAASAATSVGSRGTQSSCSSTLNDQMMLEELQELNARLNQEKKACQSAPLTRNSVLTDPLYQLSSRLPKLEAEFSEMIKEHNGLRRRKVEFKIKDFLEKIEVFKKEQRRGQELNLLQNKDASAVSPALVTFVDDNNNKSNEQENADSHVCTKGDLHHGEKDASVLGRPPVQARRGGKPPPHSAAAALNTSNVNSPRTNANSRHLLSSRQNNANNTLNNNKRTASRVSYQSAAADSVFLNDPPSCDDVMKTRADVTQNGKSAANAKRLPPKVDMEQTIMLAMWEDFTKDMSVDALKKLMAFAAKNKFNETANRGRRGAITEGRCGGNAPAFISDFKSASVFRKFLDSLSSDGDHR